MLSKYLVLVFKLEPPPKEKLDLFGLVYLQNLIILNVQHKFDSDSIVGILLCGLWHKQLEVYEIIVKIDGIEVLLELVIRNVGDFYFTV